MGDSPRGWQGLTLLACLTGCSAGTQGAPHAAAGTLNARAANTSALAPSAATASATPLQGGAAVLTADERVLLVAEADNGNLVGVDTATRAVRFSTRVGTQPVAAAVTASGRAYVVDRGGDQVVAVQLASDGCSASVVGHGAVAPDPVSLAVSADGHTLYIASGATDTVSALDAESLRTRYTVAVGREPRGVALSPDGTKLYVGHIVGGRLSVIDTTSHAVRTLELPRAPARAMLERDRAQARVLRRSDRSSAQALTRDAAPLARALVISPEGTKLFVSHMAEATGQDGVNPSEGYGASTEPGVPRIVATVSVLDLATERWVSPLVDRGAGNVPGPPAFTDPSAMTYRAFDHQLLVTSLGSRSLSVLSPEGSDPALRGHTTAFAHCDGPTGVAAARDGTTYVMCQFDHTVQVLAPGHSDQVATAITVGDETLAPEMSLGRRLFHRADVAGISRQGFSCDTCHPDGRDDGNVWSAEGTVRQTPFLAGRIEGTAPYNWLGQSHTLEDNMDQTMTRLGGDGLDARRRGALAQYLTAGLRAPVTAVAYNAQRDLVARGEQVFERAGCGDCHDPGQHFVDGRAHDVRSGRADESNTAFDTPSLRFVGLSAPYFHDGRYPSLEAMLWQNNERMGHTAGLRADDLTSLAEYLRTL